MSAVDVPVGRALHLVDLENVIGDPRAHGPGVARAYEAVLRTGNHRCGDLVVVAANARMLAQLAFTPHTACQLMVGSGPDGADLRLMAWGSPAWIAQRFDRLVVASGDGIFADVVHATCERGMSVEVLHGRGGVSARLRRPDVPLLRVPVGVGDPDDHDLAA